MRTRSKRTKMLGKQAKARSVLRQYLNKEITLTGYIKTIQDVATIGFIGKSVLFNTNKIDHFWIHLDEFKNFDVTKADWTLPITIKGTVYQYSKEYNHKIWHMKYSLCNVEVIA